MRVIDGRNAPFCWQEKEILRKIMREYKQKKEAIAVYTTLTLIASDRESDVIEEYGIAIQEKAGVGRDSTRETLNQFLDDGFIDMVRLPDTKDKVYGKLKIKLLNLKPGSQGKTQGESQGKKEGKKKSSIEDSIEDTKKEKIEKDFDSFYSLYPNKKEKLRAIRAYEKSLKITSHEVIMEGLRKYNNHISVSGMKKQYIKQPATWLNGGCWEDQYNVKVTTTLPPKPKEVEPPGVQEMSPEERQKNKERREKMKKNLFR